MALTRSGDVVRIDLATGSETVLRSYPTQRDLEVPPSRPYDLTILPSGRILVSFCCEPAAGAIAILGPRGQERRLSQGSDPQADPSGTRVAIAGLDGISILDVSLRHQADPSIELGTKQIGYVPEDPTWSPVGDALAFTLHGRLGVARLGIARISDADFVPNEPGTYLSSPTFTHLGIVAVQVPGNWGESGGGPSRLVRVDPATLAIRRIRSSVGRITDVATDRDGRHLMWVVDGAIMLWDGRVFQGRAFIAAAWSPLTE